MYIWYDRKNKRYYVGSHWGAENDGYICSSKWMSMAYLRRPHDFKRRILARVTTTRAELLDEEYRWLSMIKTHEIKVRYYNLRTHVGHWHGAGENKLKTIRERISAKTKEAMARPEVYEKFRENNKKRDMSWTEERRVLQSQKMKAIVEKRKAEGTWNTDSWSKYPRPKGVRWWNDGINNTRSVDCPGDGWVLGRTKRVKT